MKDAKIVHTSEWAAVVRGIIRSQMELRGISYPQLSVMLKARFGTDQSPGNLSSKVNKGVMGTQLFLQLLIVLRTPSLDLTEVLALYEDLLTQRQLSA